MNILNAERIALPTGRNQELIQTYMLEQGVKVPEFSGRSLHGIC